MLTPSHLLLNSCSVIVFLFKSQFLSDDFEVCPEVVADISAGHLFGEQVHLVVVDIVGFESSDFYILAGNGGDGKEFCLCRIFCAVCGLDQDVFLFNASIIVLPKKACRIVLISAMIGTVSDLMANCSSSSQSKY